MFESQRLSELAESVADGATPDWESAESTARDERDRDTVARLRAVASIGRFFATLSSRLPADRKATPVSPPGTIWGALRVIEHVGCGRFGDVYRAWDPALDREVALKILRANSDAAVESEIVDEGRLMARVRHPNVVAIHGAQRIDGATGLWMEFINGRTLAAELAERGPFPACEITRVGVELCRALAAVHAAGLVHRDVKAQNVLREDGGRIVLGDFGTGRELDDSTSSSGALAGTPAYVAPELFAGRPVTPQSDLYSLGVLLFHLTTGTYPVPGRCLRDLRDAHTHGRRTPLRSLRPDFPNRVTRAIEKALDPDPTKRFESAESMAQALEAPVLAAQSTRARWLGAAAASIAAAAVSALVWQATRPEPALIPFAARDWVLITAFENSTAESTFDGALKYTLERELSNSSFVNVVPRARIEDTLQMMRKPLDTRVDANIGQEVAMRDGGIRAIIAGRVEKLGDAYSISARIVNPANGSTATLVHEASIAPDDLVRAVGRVAVGLRRQLGETLPRLESGGTRLEKVATPSMRALHLYSQARAMTGEVALFGAPSTPRAVEQLLTDALREDPDFVWAHILMAHALRAQSGRQNAVIEHAERAAAAANPGSVDRYIAMGELNAFRGSFTTDRAERTRYFEHALATFEAALQLQPDHFWVLGRVMRISQTLGEFPGQAVVERYLAMRPNSVGVYGQAMNAAIAARNLERAKEYARRGSALEVKIDAFRGFSGNTAANLRLFAARDALRRRNPQEALLEADRLAADPRSRLPGVVNRMGLGLSDLYLTLGRLDRVEDVASWIEPESSGGRLLVIAAMEREDRGALRSLLTRLFPNLGHVLGGHGGLRASVSSAFIDAGMLDSAHRLLEMTSGAGNARQHESILLQGQLALAEGRVTHGVQLLEGLIRQDDTAELWVRTRASLELAHVWTARGDRARAVAILESATDGPFNFIEDLSPEYMRVRERLAQLYRQAGWVIEAEDIESDLRQLLAVAQDDHPMKRRLTRTAVPTSKAR